MNQKLKLLDKNNSLNFEWKYHTQETSKNISCIVKTWSIEVNPTANDLLHVITLN